MRQAIFDLDYDTVTEAVRYAIGDQPSDWIAEQTIKAANDAATQTWRDGLFINEWIAAAIKHVKEG